MPDCEASHVQNKSGVLFYSCLFVLGALFFSPSLCANEPRNSDWYKQKHSKCTFLSTGYGFYCFIIFQANCYPAVLYRPRDYAGTGMQKAWPYGRCLIAILKEERRRNGPQGHSLTPATVRHERDSNYTHPAQQPTVAFEPYDCKLSPYVVRRKKKKKLKEHLLCL